jgi:hypothetical protein
MFTWKIPEVYANEGLITHVKYFVSLSDEKNTVETEGYWHFDCPELKTPFLEVTEEMIAGWIQKEAVKDGSCHITDRLQEQLKDLESKAVPAPWMPQVFKPEI